MAQEKWLWKRWHKRSGSFRGNRGRGWWGNLRDEAAKEEPVHKRRQVISIELSKASLRNSRLILMGLLLINLFPLPHSAFVWHVRHLMTHCWAWRLYLCVWVRVWKAWSAATCCYVLCVLYVLCGRRDAGWLADAVFRCISCGWFGHGIFLLGLLGFCWRFFDGCGAAPCLLHANSALHSYSRCAFLIFSVWNFCRVFPESSCEGFFPKSNYKIHLHDFSYLSYLFFSYKIHLHNFTYLLLSSYTYHLHHLHQHQLYHVHHLHHLHHWHHLSI